MPPSPTNTTPPAKSKKVDDASSFVAYEYDRLNRLTNSVCSLGSLRSFAANHQYDPAGNVTNTAVSSTDCADLVDFSYAYDAAERLTNIVQGTNSMVLEWDERYRLKRFVVPPSGGSVEYEYDVFGRRASRIGIPPEGGTTNVEHYVYNGNQVVADLDGAGNVLRTYVWGSGIDNLLCFTDHATSNTYYAIKDHQNTVIVLVDETGAVVESYEYSAYGEILDVKDGLGNSIGNRQSELGNRYTFQGREIDWTTGLYYFRARWYDPVAGRWLSKDPIGISGGLNLYVFCGNNPVNFIDPYGWAPGDMFPTIEDAARDFSSSYNAASISSGQEYGTAIYGSSGQYTYSTPDIGTNGDSVDVTLEKGTVALAHTHGKYDPNYANNIFSPDDKNAASTVVPGWKTGDTKIYVATPNGSFMVYDPKAGKVTVISTDMPSDPNDPTRKNNRCK